MGAKLEDLIYLMERFRSSKRTVGPMATGSLPEWRAEKRGISILRVREDGMLGSNAKG